MVMAKVARFNGLDVVALAMDRKVFKRLMKKKQRKVHGFSLFPYYYLAILLYLDFFFL
jgi:hypothetical protein